jgi:hypothetical protein
MSDNTQPIATPHTLPQQLYMSYIALAPALALIGAQIAPPELLGPALAMLREPSALWLAIRASLVLGWIVYVGLAAELITPPRQAWLALLLTFDTPLLMAVSALLTGSLDTSILCLSASIELVSVELGLTAVVFFGSTRVSPKEGVALLAALGFVALTSFGALSLFAALWWSMWSAGEHVRAASMLVALAWSTVFAGRRLLAPKETDEDSFVYILLGIAGPIFGGFLFIVARAMFKGFTGSP